MDDFVNIEDKRLRHFLNIDATKLSMLISQNKNLFSNGEWLKIYNNLGRICPVIRDLEEQANKCIEILSKYADVNDCNWNDKETREAYFLYGKIVSVYHTLVVCAKSALDENPFDVSTFEMGEN